MNTGYPRANAFVGIYSMADFKPIIERAESAYQNQNGSDDLVLHFSGSILKNNGKGRPKEDYKLSRYACYLIAMNGDPRKSEVAAAQSYFAVKAREAETVIPAQNERLNIFCWASTWRALLRSISSWSSISFKRSNDLYKLHGPQVTAFLRGAIMMQ